MLSRLKSDILQAESKTAMLIMVFIVVILAMMGIFLSDTYVAALPAISHDLKASQTAVKLSVSVFLLGITLAQLFFGPLSDAIGRKKVMIPGLIVAFAGSILCLLSSDIDLLIIGRFIQGVGMGAVVVNARVLPMDLYSGDKLIKFVGFMSTAVGLAPALAPLIGGGIQHVFGWHAVFIFMLLCVLACLIMTVFVLPETNRQLQPQAFKIKVMLKNYWQLLHIKRFMIYLLTGASMFSMIMVFFTLSPFLLQLELGMIPLSYSVMVAVLTSLTLVSRILAQHLLRWFEPKQIIFFSAIVFFLAAAVMFILALCSVLTIYSLVIPMAIIFFSGGGIFGNSLVLAMQDVQNNKGAAGALFGALRVLLAAVVCMIVSHIHCISGLCLGTVALVFGVAMFYSQWILQST